MQVKSPNRQEQKVIFPREAMLILETLSKMEDFAIELRKEILADMKLNGNSLHLKLNRIDF